MSQKKKLIHRPNLNTGLTLIHRPERNKESLTPTHKPRVRKPRINNKGFTLTEVLTTVVLVGLMSTAVAAGVAAAIRSYNSIRLKADAQTLLGTAVSAMTVDMSPATDVRVEGGNVIFYSGYRGYSMCYRNSATDGILVAPAGNVSDIPAIPLLTQSTQTLGLYTRIGTGEAAAISYSADRDARDYHCFSFTLEVVNGKTGDTVESEKVYIHSSESDLSA